MIAHDFLQPNPPYLHNGGFFLPNFSHPAPVTMVWNRNSLDFQVILLYNFFKAYCPVSLRTTRVKKVIVICLGLRFLTVHRSKAKLEGGFPMKRLSKLALLLIVSVTFVLSLIVHVQPAQAYTFVRTDMKVELDSTQYPNTYIFSYYGQKGGKEWLKYALRWKSGKEYTYADLYFGCSVPPASVPAGGKVNLELGYQMVGFRGWTHDGTYSAPSNECFVKISGTNCRDANNQAYLWPGAKNTNFLKADVNVSRSFSGYMPNWQSVGSILKIEFFCYAGRITWFYKLVN